MVFCTLISVADLLGAIGFSSFGVLMFYLVATLPPLSVMLGVLMFVAGMILRLVRPRRKP